MTDVQKKMLYARGKRVKTRRRKRKQTFGQRSYWGEKEGKKVDRGYKCSLNVEICV